jgi:bifunctional oligoribonuclease and PAP phosphatase NrnA
LERCGLSEVELPGAQAFVCIDHHPHADGQEPANLVSFVDPSAAAAGELVYEVLMALGTEMTADIATCLLAALMVDTGRFSFSNTSPQTHRIAAELVAAGARVTEVSDEIWGCRPLRALQLMAKALSTLQLAAGGRIAWAVLRSADYHAVGANAEDTEGIIDQVRTVQGAEVALLFSERRGQARVSLRSHGHVDVSAIARRFGGGGHAKAAGISSEAPLDEVIPGVLAAVEEALIV